MCRPRRETNPMRTPERCSQVFTSLRSLAPAGQVLAVTLPGLFRCTSANDKRRRPRSSGRTSGVERRAKATAPVGALAAVDVATVRVAEGDATSLTFTAPVWKQMDRGREHHTGHR